MNPTLPLSSGRLRCDIRPDLGGCIAALWWGDVAVLRSTAGPALSNARLAGSYPLVPFSNRVAQAQLVWAGTSHPLVQNNAAEPHAIHGVGWQRVWEVLDQSDDFALLTYQHKADAAWPFAFASSQAFKLSSSERGATLEMSLSLTNQAPSSAPAGLGWHPYFVKRASSQVRFAATGRWQMGADKLPTTRVPDAGLNTDCATLEVDHCFDGWTGAAELTDELLKVAITSNLSRLVVFTNATRDFVAIEPVSHVNNAVNLSASGLWSADDLGLRVLEPGESMSAVMSVNLESQQ